MSYSAEISRTHPALFGFLIDESYSMEEELDGGAGTTKSKICADYLNAFFNTLLLRNIDGESVKNRFEIFAIGYGGNGETRSALPSVSMDDMPINLEKLQKISIQEIKEKKIIKREPDGAGGILEKEETVEVSQPKWLEATHNGTTPMGLAFRNALQITEDWVSSHRDSFPPIIINITDGMYNDEDPEPIAENLKILSTDDGEVLVFNIHLTADTKTKAVLFPDDSYLDDIPDEDYAFLFRMSSYLTENMIKYAKSRDRPISQSAKGFAFNADFAGFVDFLDIGTRPAVD